LDNGELNDYYQGVGPGLMVGVTKFILGVNAFLERAGQGGAFQDA